MNNRPINLIALGLGFAGWLYVLLYPKQVKEANESPRYHGLGFGSKPLWFWRILGLIGSVICGIIFFHLLFVGGK